MTISSRRSPLSSLACDRTHCDQNQRVSALQLALIRPLARPVIAPTSSAAERTRLLADGCVAVPDGPGLGIELDKEGLERIMARPWHTRRG